MSSETPSTRGTTTATTSSGLESTPSTESTVPTDLTLSPSDLMSTGGTNTMAGVRQHRYHTASSQITKQVYERKQLLHDLQLIKIELSQKTLLMDSLKAQYMARTEELEERLADATHDRQLTRARLEAQLQMERDETRRRLDEARVQMDRILAEQKQLEERNGKLEEAATVLKGTIRDIDLVTDDEYLAMQAQDVEQLSLRNYISIKVYEMLWPLKTETNNLRTKMKLANEDKHKLTVKCEQLEEERSQERQQFAQLMSKYNRTTTDLEVAKSEIRSGDYKVENYDKIKSERDRLLEECLEAKNAASVLRATSAGQKKDLNDMKSELMNQQQKISLLEQDKEFLSKRFAEINSRNHLIEERLSTATLQLEKMTQAREDVYERYVGARDFYKSEFERRLKEELESIQLKTSTEIETLRRTAKEMHEQEIRSLRDARDMAVSQREKFEKAERQALSKYERLLDEIRKSQNEDTVTQSSLRSQLTLRTFELEQTKLLHVETQNNCQQLQLENEKLNKKIEILNEELHNLQGKLQSEVVLLQAQVKEKSSNLFVYEKLEQELDDVVVQAAEVADDGDGEKLLLSFGREIGVPTSIRRRLQQSFQLAKRILSLEKLNVSLKKEIDKQNSQLHHLSEELLNCQDLLARVGEPHTNFIETIQSRENEIKQHKLQIAELEQNIKHATKDKEELIAKNEITLKELEKARNNREEVAKMKQLLITLFPNRFSPSNIQNVRMNNPTRAATIAPITTTTSTIFASRNASSHPKATIFTKTRKVYKPP